MLKIALSKSQIRAALRFAAKTGDAVAEAINDKRAEDHVAVMNALAWYALEEVSRAYCDAAESD